MNTFGVCVYDFDAVNPEIKELIKFKSYEKAFNYYLKKLPSKRTGYLLPEDFWLVILNDDNEIVQFEQLNWNTKCKIVKII